MADTPQPSPTPRQRTGISVFSGGTAANFLVDVFDQIVSSRKCPLRYIIPISDNGGSSSELIRVFGGPSMSASPPFSIASRARVLTLEQVLVTCAVSTYL